MTIAKRQSAADEGALSARFRNSKYEIANVARYVQTSPRKATNTQTEPTRTLTPSVR